ERLDVSGEAQVAHAAHAAWVAELGDAADVGARGPEQPRHVGQVGAQRANIDGALAWEGAADPGLALTIATRLGWVWMQAGDHGAAERMAAALAAAGTEAPADLRLRGSLLLGWFHAAAGDAALGRRTVEAAFEQHAFDGDH